MKTTQLTAQEAISIILNFWVAHSEGEAQEAAIHARAKFYGANFGLFDSITDSSFEGIYGFANSLLGRCPELEFGDKQFIEAAELILKRTSPHNAINNGSTDPFGRNGRDGNWLGEAI